jgi:hypothetical protein
MPLCPQTHAEIPHASQKGNQDLLNHVDTCHTAGEGERRGGPVTLNLRLGILRQYGEGVWHRDWPNLAGSRLTSTIARHDSFKVFALALELLLLSSIIHPSRSFAPGI